MINRDIEGRFWARVKKGAGDECWVWREPQREGKRYHKPSPLKRATYGNFMIDRKNYVAHRISWELKYGDIPEGMNVCHKCDNKRCVRPDHLFLGTQSDNLQDLHKKIREAGGRDAYAESRKLVIPNPAFMNNSLPPE